VDQCRKLNFIVVLAISTINCKCIFLSEASC